MIKHYYSALSGKNFYSQLPYALGNTSAMKFRFISKQPHNDKPEDGNKRQQLRDGLSETLSPGGVGMAFDVEVQLSDQPNGDLVMREAHKSWSEEDHPPIKVGELHFPPQKLENHNAAATGLLDAFGETHPCLPRNQGNRCDKSKIHKRLFFHPLITSRLHEPLGEVNAYRSHFYPHHARSRRDSMQKGVWDEPKNSLPMWVDFDALRAHKNCEKVFGSASVCTP